MINENRFILIDMKTVENYLVSEARFCLVDIKICLIPLQAELFYDCLIFVLIYTKKDEIHLDFVCL